MKYFVYIVFLFAPIALHAQSNEHEQKAFDYFMEKVFNNEYKEIKSIEFTGFTEEHLTSLDYGGDCFSHDLKLALSLTNNALNKILEKKKIIVSAKYSIKVKPLHKNSKTLKLSIRQANEVNNKYYVTIELTKRLRYIDVYLFELDNSGNVLRFCKTGAVF